MPNSPVLVFCKGMAVGGWVGVHTVMLFVWVGNGALAVWVGGLEAMVLLTVHMRYLGESGHLVGTQSPRAALRAATRQKTLHAAFFPSFHAFMTSQRIPQ